MLSGSGHGIAARDCCCNVAVSASMSVATAVRAESSSSVRTAASMRRRTASASATAASSDTWPADTASSGMWSATLVAGFALLLERAGAFLRIRGSEDRQPDLELDFQRLLLGE